MWGRIFAEKFSLESAGSYSSAILTAVPITPLSLSMFSSVYYIVFYSIFKSSLSHLYFQTSSSLQWFQHHPFPVCSGSSCSHLSCLQFTLSSHPSFTATFFLFFHPSFLPSGSLEWCDAGWKTQGYMWYRV